MQKRLLTLITFIIFWNYSYAQNDVVWVRTIISQGYNDVRAMCTDSAGNVYAAGQLEYTANFGGTSLSTSGGHDIFVAKYDSAGNLKWARKAGGSSGDVGYGVAVDLSGNVFVVGEFEKTAKFGSFELTVQGDGNNFFIAKYSPSGTIQWVKSIGTNAGSTKGYGVTVDEQGNVYAVGTTASRAILDGTRLFSTRGSTDAMVIKLSNNGSYVWHKQIGGSGSDKAFGVKARNGALYVTGSFSGTCEFSSSVSLSSGGGTDFFLVKYNYSGSVQWAKKGGGSGDDIGWDVVVNNNDDVICTGEFWSTATFGSSSLSSSGSSDMFVTAYNSSGSHLWARKGGGSSVDFGYNIAVDRKSNIYVGGSFSRTGRFGSLSSIVSKGDKDLFMISYTANGTERYVKHFGGTGSDRGRGVGTDRYGNVYFSGEFWKNIQFDSFTVQGVDKFDGFILRMGNYPVCSASATQVQTVSCASSCDATVSVQISGEAPYSYNWYSASSMDTDTISGLCAGVYPVEVVDAFYCVSRDTISITEPALLDIQSADIINENCIGCSNGGIRIQPTGGTPPYTYHWPDAEAADVRMNLPAGTYNVCVEDANNCSVCETYVIQTRQRSLKDAIQNMRSSLVLSPNPAKEKVRIQFPQDFEFNENFELKLYSVTGKLMLEKIINSDNHHFSVSGLSGGIYFMHLIHAVSGERMTITPLIIE